VKGDKVIAYKQKRRKGFRKKKGHRTLYTQIKINSISNKKSEN
jgi:large subunit ribosomal protein L21